MALNLLAMVFFLLMLIFFPIAFVAVYVVVVNYIYGLYERIINFQNKTVEANDGFFAFIVVSLIPLWCVVTLWVMFFVPTNAADAAVFLNKARGYGGISLEIEIKNKTLEEKRVKEIFDPLLRKSSRLIEFTNYQPPNNSDIRFSGIGAVKYGYVSRPSSRSYSRGGVLVQCLRVI